MGHNSDWPIVFRRCTLKISQLKYPVMGMFPILSL